MIGVLATVGRHGRLCLVAGLVAGVALPGVALAMRPWLPELVGLLLFVSAVRIGPRAALGGLADLRKTLGIVLAYQVALPLIAIGVALAVGALHWPLVLAAILMLSAPSVTGSPAFTALLGHEPAPAMRLLILGTALFPLTVLPVLWALPVLGGPTAVAGAAGQLLTVIAVAVGLGFALRHWGLPSPSAQAVRALDGLSALTLAVVVVGLMSAIGPALRADPLGLAGWVVGVCALNLGLQIGASFVFGRGKPDTAARSIVAGNRNIALFLVALPPDVTDPLLMFIGCYQIPMYLTPMLMGRVYGPPPKE